VKLWVVSVGKDRSGLFDAAVAEYTERIGRFAQLQLVELRAEGVEKEGAAILGKAKSEIWALDPRGVELSSEELAARLRKLRDSARDLSLCIGGDEGLAENVRKSSHFVWSLGKLTLPHRLARVVVLEQLYRAFEILRGSPYHK
jgi:23S rRNA (pseudouridine1915-N3)-methyltransferase